MSDERRKFWNTVPIYKGYLPAKDSLLAQNFVILACKVDAQRESSSTALPLAAGSPSSCTSPQLTAAKSPSIGASTPVGATPLHVDGSVDSDSDFGGLSFASRPNAEQDAAALQQLLASGRLAFYVYRKRDVVPPPLKYTLSPKQLNYCFFVCEREKCSCEKPHVRRGTWRLRVDTLTRTPLTVSDKGQNRRLAQTEILPTAGYFFALGLLRLQAVQAVVPAMCRFNKNCRNGCRCLYIHADVAPGPTARHQADIPLKDWAGDDVRDALGGNEDEQKKFFNFLVAKGITTTGDLQVLGVPAFEALAVSMPPQWAEALLITAVLRNFDRKFPLNDALATFPRVKFPISLPETLRTIGDLLDISATAFYRLSVLPHVMDAMEIIRIRYESDEPYNVITLSKLPSDSFFVKITEVINQFRRHHAHSSWRKHDPKRPVVTSVITYVDVTQCHCVSMDASAQDEDSFKDEWPTAPLPPLSPTAAVGAPIRSWCSCPRRWEIAVNYELSTPSGSRCSEQNAMGKLAALGVPTWAVRDIFVHGMNVKKEANPLFPCGVCENMLQKVNKDVESKYHGDVTLYMFDATQPRKIVYLPVQEISHRDGLNFKRFVAEDLRDS